jgi:hypothetical protein
MVQSDGQLCWRERLARKEAMNIIDAAAPSPDTSNPWTHGGSAS